MSDVHELREYYESFGQSLKDEIVAEKETSVSDIFVKIKYFFES